MIHLLSDRCGEGVGLPVSGSSTGCSLPPDELGWSGGGDVAGWPGCCLEHGGTVAQGESRGGGAVRRGIGRSARGWAGGVFGR